MNLNAFSRVFAICVAFSVLGLVSARAEEAGTKTVKEQIEEWPEIYGRIEGHAAGFIRKVELDKGLIEQAVQAGDNKATLTALAVDANLNISAIMILHERLRLERKTFDEIFYTPKMASVVQYFAFDEAKEAFWRIDDAMNQAELDYMAIVVMASP